MAGKDLDASIYPVMPLSLAREPTEALEVAR